MKQTNPHMDVQADTTWLDSCLTISAAHPGSVPLTSCVLQRPQGLQLNMRLIARFVVLMVAVFGVSLAFA